MTDKVLALWPELLWINDTDLREKTAKTWELALEKSVLTPEDLNRIPFTLLAGPDLKVSFMAHKRCVVHVARDAGNKMNEFFKDDLPVNMDVLIAGAILADVGKLLEYEMKDGKPNLVTYDLRDGTYIIPKVMDSGYVELGKKKMEFTRKG